MATVVMRNRVTSEFRKIEKDSEDFWELRAELHADGRPRWEQTGEHDLAAFQTRLNSGLLREQDVGDEHQPVASQVASAAPENMGFGGDRGYPTPGEISQKAGRAGDMSDEELQAAAARHGIAVGTGADPGSGFPAGHPPDLDDETAQEYGVHKTSAPAAKGELSDEKASTVEDANAEHKTSSRSRSRKSDDKDDDKKDGDDNKSPASGRAQASKPAGDK